MTGLELLAPARDADVAREAILHGADAVYIGAGSHGARAAAANSTDDIAGLVSFAHRYGVRVYVTLNTIIHDAELATVATLVRNLYRASVDALIVQDMALLRLPIPPIDLHASTQCDIRTPQKAAFLAGCGFSQLVLPRELSLDEIRTVSAAVPGDVALEAFVHGALCVSYSGDCQAGYAASGRSANRGECPQMCRLPYTLTDAAGNTVSVNGRPVADRHLLSLRDLCRIDDITALADAGVSSFKIEGRLKDAAYVKTTVAAYRAAIDAVIAANPGRYRRASWGSETVSFVPDVNRAFNRGFTSYFLNGRPDDGAKMASLDTPKWIGLPVGTVVSVSARSIKARLKVALNNGDGLGFFGSDGRYRGFRLNRADGDVLFPAPGDDAQWRDIPSGAVLYRNSDSALAAALSRETAARKIDIRIVLTATEPDSAGNRKLTLALSDDFGHSVSHTITIPDEVARSPQADNRKRALTKFGDTIFRLSETHSDGNGTDDSLLTAPQNSGTNSASYTDLTPERLFMPASTLASLRRETTALLLHEIDATYPYRYRRPETPGNRLPEGTALTYHDNVANREAERFYLDRGARLDSKALETLPRHTIPAGTTVMTTRYCLRRELGACLRNPSSDLRNAGSHRNNDPILCHKSSEQLPTTLFITSGRTRYRLDFDCLNCQMHVLTT